MMFRTRTKRPAGAESTSGALQARATRGLSCLAAGLALAFLGGCDNLFSGEDLKAKIKDEVTVTNAESVNVNISMLPAGGGTLSLSGDVVRKLGVGFPLSAYPSGLYVFSGWTSTGSGNVMFSNPDSASTTATIGAAASDARILANFTARPKLVDWSPTGTNVLLNQAIYVQFDKPMQVASFDTGTISVTAKASIAGAPVQDILDHFSIDTSTGDGFILHPVEDMPASSKISVTVSKTVTDADGNAMSETTDHSWSFTTGYVSDSSVPTIDSVSVLNGQGSAPTANLYDSAYAVKGLPITLVTSANSHSAAVSVTGIRITEKDISSGVESSTSWLGFNPSYAYTLQTAGDGKKEIRIAVQNSNGKVSVSDGVATVLLDTTPPDLSSLALSSSAGGAWAKSGETLYLDFQASDVGTALYSKSATLANRPATVGDFVPGYRAAAAVGGTSTEGLATYSVTVTDFAGNSTTLAAGASGNVTVDRTPPIIGTLTLGTGVAYTTTPSLAISTPSATDNYSTTFEVATSLDNGATWGGYAAYTTGSSTLVLSSEGQVSTAVKFRDLAGNETAPIAKTIIYDKSPPLIADFELDAGSDWTKSATVTATATITDTLLSASSSLYPVKARFASSSGGLSSATYADFSGSASVPVSTSSEGMKTVYAQFKDAAGNETVVEIKDSIVYDKTAPVVTGFNLDGVAAWTKNLSAKAGATVTDALLSAGFAVQVSFSIDGGVIWSAYEDFSSGMTAAALTEGDKTVRAKFKDAAGNETTATISDSIICDPSAPTVSGFSLDSAADWTLDDTVTVGATVTDTLLSISSTTYPVQASFSTDGGLTWSAYADFASGTMTVKLSAEGSKTVNAKFKDAAGNETTAEIKDSIVYDKSAPDVTEFKLDAGADWTKAATVTATATIADALKDAGYAVKARFASSFGGLSSATYADFSGSASVPVSTSSEGTKTVYAQFKDAAGNETVAEIKDDIGYENTPPVVTLKSIATSNAVATRAKKGDVITLKFTADDGSGWSGVASVSATIVGTSVTAPWDVTDLAYVATYTITDGTAQVAITYTINATDEAGNSSSNSAVTSTIVCDRTPPAPVKALKLTANDDGTVTVEVDVPTPADSDYAGADVAWTDGGGSTDSYQLTETANASFTVSGLIAGTLYTFSARSRDLAGNLQSDVNASVTTKGTAPAGFVASRSLRLDGGIASARGRSAGSRETTWSAIGSANQRAGLEALLTTTALEMRRLDLAPDPVVAARAVAVPVTYVLPRDGGSLAMIAVTAIVRGDMVAAASVSGESATRPEAKAEEGQGSVSAVEGPKAALKQAGQVRSSEVPATVLASYATEAPRPSVPPIPAAPDTPAPRQGGEQGSPPPRLALAPSVSDWRRRGFLAGRREE